MNIENTKAQMRKGVLEYCILSILKDGEAYTSDILESLRTQNCWWSREQFIPCLHALKTQDCFPIAGKNQRADPHANTMTSQKPVIYF